MTIYHFVLTLQQTNSYGQQLTSSTDGTVDVAGKTRDEVLASVRAAAIEASGSGFKNAVILFFSLEPNTFPHDSQEEQL